MAETEDQVPAAAPPEEAAQPRRWALLGAHDVVTAVVAADPGDSVRAIALQPGQDPQPGQQWTGRAFRDVWWARTSPTDGTMLAYAESAPDDATDWVPIPVGCDLVKKLGHYAWSAERKAWLPRKGIATVSQDRITLDHLTPMMLALMIEQWARDPLAGPPAACIEWAAEYRKTVDAAALRKHKNPRLKDLRGRG